MLKNEYLERNVSESSDELSDDDIEFDLSNLSDYFNYPRKFKKGKVKEIYVAS